VRSSGRCSSSSRPTLAFDADVAEAFFAAMRDRFDGPVAREPRHATWFEGKAEKLVTKFRVARVAADPAVVEGASVSGAWGGLVYYRLHGSPRVYYSASWTSRKTGRLGTAREPQARRGRHPRQGR
jgi:uncharacterized protein YecE (DUF72 family)